MAKRSNRPFDDLDITKSELKQIGEAFKKKEFVQLFAEYAKEVNDPKNKELFESEIKQLEKERGNDVTFLHPKPGYVIKTSVDGNQKAFINICHNENIGKPSAARAEKDGSVGLNWSVPYTHVKGRVDFDKKNNYCMFYDVIFHPDSIHLAKKNSQFKQLVEDTALSAVEDINDVKLDRKNLKYPKAGYKGPAQSSVIRKKAYGTSENSEDMFQIPNYPYPDINVDEKPKESVPRASVDHDEFTTPVYILKQRKDVDLQDYTYGVDAKIHSSIPTEIVIEVDLPLVKCAADVDLEIDGKLLTLVTQKSAKYKLKVTLPYSVNDQNGTAKFDTEAKRLIVTLPVVRKKFVVTDFVKEDSGIESDHPTNRSSSEEDISKDIEIISSTEALSLCDNEDSSLSKDIEIISSTELLSLDDTYRDSKEVCDILKPDRLYTFPPFTISQSGCEVHLNLNVTNVEPSSFQHSLEDPSGVHMTFSSMGSGCFPTYYAFFIQIEGFSTELLKIRAEVYENSLFVQLQPENLPDFVLSKYFAGLEPQSLKEYFYDVSWPTAPWTEIEDDRCESSKTDCQKEINDEKDEQCLTPSSDNSPPNAQNEHLNEIQRPITQKKKLASKSRTVSESTLEPSDYVPGRRSILKKSRSLSESHTEEYYNWSSLDSEDNNYATKKTVRFSDVISKKVFRQNSSILGQKKKNERKSKNKKKAWERRRSSSISSDIEESESFSEMSEVSDFSSSDVTDISDVSSDDNSTPAPFLECAKKHRRRGSKNRRKNAATAKQNFILDED